jgi:hypothetical protein
MIPTDAHEDDMTPRTLPEYLQALREALRGADPALVQDALYDAEEYIRGELAARPGTDEATLLAEVASSYGAPEEVAEIYTVREEQVRIAMRPRPAADLRSATAPAGWRRGFFGVALDPRTYGALFYMLLALPLGVFYFAWVVVGVSMSLGLAILIIGVPFTIAFIGTIHALSLVEGRLVESLLGERMPRRSTPTAAAAPLLTRIGNVLSDPRTWSTLLYMLLMLPLGMVYFSLAVALLSLSLGLFFGALAYLLQVLGLPVAASLHYGPPGWTAPFAAVIGVLLFFATLHLVRGIGRVHGAIAKAMLVARAA